MCLVHRFINIDGDTHTWKTSLKRENKNLDIFWHDVLCQILGQEITFDKVLYSTMDSSDDQFH